MRTWKRYFCLFLALQSLLIGTGFSNNFVNFATYSVTEAASKSTNSNSTTEAIATNASAERTKDVGGGTSLIVKKHKDCVLHQNIQLEQA